MGYIYGIYADNELIYIGKTTRSLEQRFKEHRTAVYNKHEQRVHILIWQYLKSNAKVQMKQLYEIEDPADLKFMEDKLIFQLQPIGNVQGSLVNHRKDKRRN